MPRSCNPKLTKGGKINLLGNRKSNRYPRFSLFGALVKAKGNRYIPKPSLVNIGPTNDAFTHRRKKGTRTLTCVLFENSKLAQMMCFSSPPPPNNCQMASQKQPVPEVHFAAFEGPGSLARQHSIKHPNMGGFPMSDIVQKENPALCDDVLLS